MDGYKLIPSGTKRRLRKNRARAGFGIAPILYMLGLIGVGAGVLFSSYSQSIKNNINMTNGVAVKNDLDSASTTLAATSVMSTDGTILCPPQGGNASAECISAPTTLTDFYKEGSLSLGALATDVHMPALNTSTIASGAPSEIGVFTSGAGTKQLDPWGHYYVVCRWENSPSNAGTPAFQIISAGPAGTIDTQCGSSPPAPDSTHPVNYTTSMNAANAVNRSSIWQVTPAGSTTPLKVSYGAEGISADSTGNLTVPGWIAATGDYNSANGNITLTGGGLSAATGAITGLLTAQGLAFEVKSGGAILAANGAFNVASTGTMSAASGMFTVGTGGALMAENGAFVVDSNGMTISNGLNSVFTVVSASGNTSISGTLAAIGTVTLGTAGTTTTPSLTTYGEVNIGTTAQSGTNPLPYLSVGTATAGSPPTYPFYVTQAGAVMATSVTASSFNGTLNGSVNGGSVSATSITDSGTLSVTGAATIPTISGSTLITGNLTVSGTINGAMTIGTGGVTLSGVVPIANGGTGASTALQALTNLGGTNASNLTSGTLGAALLPPVSPNPSGGPYNEVTVDQYGRVTSGQWVAALPGINDGNGDSAVVGSGDLTITLGSSVQGFWDATGLMVGSSLPPKNKLDVYGATAIGVGYAGVDTAPTNGLIVVGSVGIGTSNPTSALQVVGTVTAGSFVGNIGAGSITGTVGTGNGGTGTNTTFTQGSVVFAGVNGVYSQDNGQFFWDDTNHRLGIGTANPSAALQINGATADATTTDMSIRDSTGTPILQVRNDGIIFLPSGGSISTGNGSGLPYSGPQFSSDGTNWLRLTASGDVGSSSAGVGIFYFNQNYYGWERGLTIQNVASGGTPFLSLMQDGGNVGIGAASAGVTLDLSNRADALALPGNTSGAGGRPSNLINGEIRYNSATPAIEAYVNNAWVTLLSSGGGGGGVTGSGTTNYVARWINSTTLGTGTLYDNGTQVGIGTTAPGTALQLGSGQLSLPNGTSGAPAIAFTNDLTSGMYLSSTGQLQFVGGGETALLNANGFTAGTFMMGNVYFGNPNSNRTKLGGGVPSTTVPGIMRGDDLTTGLGLGGSGIVTLISGGVDALHVASGGKIGIGTNGPLNTLDVNGTGIHIGSGVPGTTTYDLYNSSGTLYWNGNPIASGSGGWTGSTITVPEGGTGDTTLTQYGVLIGEGTNPIQATPIGATGTVFQGVTGANPAFSADLTYNGKDTNPLGAYVPVGTQVAAVNLGTSSSVRVVPTAATTFYGITGGVDGRIVRMHNASNYTLTLSNLSGSDVAANQIITGTGADMPIPTNTSVTMQYDGTSGNWRVTGSSNAAKVLAAGSDKQIQFNDQGVMTGSTGLVYDYTNGRVGIGTTSPVDALDVSGNIGALAGNSLFVYDSTNAHKASLYIDGSLQAWLSNSNGNIMLKAAGGTIFENWNGSAYTQNMLVSSSGYVGIYNGATIGTSYVATTPPTNGAIIQGNVGIGTTSPAATLQVAAGTSTGTNGYGLEVAAPSGATNNYAAVFQSGNVGIGTTSPGDLLTVYSTINYHNIVMQSSAASDIFGFRISGTGAGGRDWRLEQGRAAAGYFNITDCTAGCTPRLTIDTSGNVGIGTTTPASTLSVNGGAAIGSYAGANAAASGNLIVSGNIGIGTTSPNANVSIGNLGTSGTTTPVLIDLGGTYSTTPGAYPKLNIYDDSSGRFVSMGSSSYSFDFMVSSGVAYNWYVAGANIMKLGSNGYLGIGSTSPLNTLDVTGTGIHLASGVPGTTTNNELYSSGTTLYWNGNAISAGGGTVDTGLQYQMAYFSGLNTVGGDANITTDASNNLDILTGNINFGGSGAQAVSMGRSATAGNALTVQAGGGLSSGTNESGGNLILASGISTGTGSSQIQFTTYPGSTSGTADNLALAAATLSASGTLAAGTVNTTLQGASVAAGSSNLNGGNLTLASGISTGTGTSNINFKVYPGLASGTAQNSPTTAMTVLGNGNVGIGTTVPVSKFHIGSAPTASANYGLASFGSGAFDGATAGYFGTGSSSNSNGTILAVNTASGYGGDLVNFEIAGTSEFKIDPSGNVTMGDKLYMNEGAGGIVICDSDYCGSAAGQYATSIGRYAIASGGRSIAIGGYNVVASGDNAVSIGDSSSATGGSAVSLGANSQSSGGNVAIGAGASAQDYGAVAIGGGASVPYAEGHGTTAIGNGANSSYVGSIALGGFAISTAPAQFVVGSTSFYNDTKITDVYIGNGVTSPAPVNVTYHGVGGSGSNVAGGNLTFAGGLGTGNATTGDIIFQGAATGSSGSTAELSSPYMTIKGGGATAGNVGIGTTSPGTPLQIQSGNSFFQLDPANAMLRMFHAGDIDAQMTLANGGFNFNYGIVAMGGGQFANTLTLAATAGGPGTASSGIVFQGIGVAHGNIAWMPNEKLFVLHTNNGALGTTDLYGAPGLVIPGSVGIGTTSPADTLDVTGTGIHIGSGTPGTTSYDLYNNGGILYWNGTPLAAAGASGTVNGGTLYQMAYYAANGTAVSGDANITTDAAGDLIVVGSAQATYFNATTAATGYELGGANGLSFPTDAGHAASSIAIGSGALSSQPTTASNFTHNLATDPPTGTYGNTTLGYQAIGSTGLTTSAWGNTAVGYQAEEMPLSYSSGNTAVGFQAGQSNIGYQSTALGYRAGQTNMSDNETAVGYQAGQTSMGMDSVAVGELAGNYVMGESSVAVGFYAGFDYMGTYGVAVGSYAGGTYMGSNSVAMGPWAGYSHLGANSIAIGSSSLYSTSSAMNETAIGTLSGYSVTTGANNTLLGYQAGYDLTSGAQNITVGYFPTTGVGVTSGSNNIMIGYDVRPTSQSGSNQLNIGNLIYGTSLGTGATLSTGFVGIGTNSPAYALDVNGSIDVMGDTITNAGDAGGGALRISPSASSGGQVYFITTGQNAVAKFYNSNGTNFLGIQNVGTSGNIWTSSGPIVLQGSGGNVGIGSTSPLNTLDVTGTGIHLASGVPGTTTNNELYSSGTTLYWNGNAISSGGGTVDTGLQYQMAYFSSANTVGGDANITTDASNNLDILTGNINLGGSGAQAVSMGRSASTGNALTVQAGGGVALGTNESGGNLILASGISTGTGSSQIQFNAYPAATASSATDNAAMTALSLSASGSFAAGTAATSLAAARSPVGASNTNGGNLNFYAGTPTGTGQSTMNFYMPNFGSTGTADNTVNNDIMQIYWNGVIIGAGGNGGALNVNGNITSHMPFPGAAGGAFVATNDEGGGQTAVNDTLGSLIFKGEDSAWNNFTAGLIKTVATNVTDGATAGTMSFQTAVAGTLADRMTIYNGNVGIGTSSPTTLLEALSSGANSAQLFLHSSAFQGAGNTAEVILGPGSGFSTTTAPRVYSYQENSGVGSPTDLRFDTYNNARITAMVLSAAGNVGIGTTSPAAKLDVYTSAGVGAIDLGGVNGISYPSTDSTAGGSIAIGNGALLEEPSLTAATAFGNIAVGYQAIGSTGLTAAAMQNTAIGYQTLAANTSGAGNAALGYQALQYNASGNDNTAVGDGAMTATSGSPLLGQANVAIGYAAAAHMSGWAQTNVVVGAAAGLWMGGSSNNVIIGAQAMYYPGNGNNVAIGNGAGGSSAGGTSANNTIVGASAMDNAYNTLTGANNSGFGYEALYNLTTTGHDNTAIGYTAGNAITTGNLNIVLGEGGIITSGSGNILIGNGLGAPTVAANSNQLNIGNVITGTGINTPSTSTIVFPGTVGIGTTSPQATLDVNGFAKLKLNASAPTSCSATTQGAFALTHTARSCICDATNTWSDTVSGTACVW